MRKITCMLLLIHGGFMMAQTKTVVTQHGEKVTISPFANNGLTQNNGYTQLGGALTKASVLTTTSAYTLAITGLQAGSASDNVLVSDANGVLKFVLRSSFSGADNLGNHIATMDLNMSNKNIANIFNAYIKNDLEIFDRVATNSNYFGIYKNNGLFGIWNNSKNTNALTIDESTNKTTLVSAQISKGTDGSIPAAGSVAVSTDANGNIRWAAPSTIAGATGPQGPKGDTGSQGSQGIQGLTGATGPKGDTGAQGIQGLTGTTGPKGDTGAQGIQGLTGATGPKGDTGAQGIQGLTGATGPKGDTGVQGIQGLTGATGPKGDTGATGPAGAAPTTGAGTITGKNLIAISAGDNNAFKNTDISLTAGTDKQVLQTVGTTPTWVNASTIGDNLGNHIATQDLNMSSKNILNINNAYIKNEVQVADRITSNTNYFGIYKNNGSFGIWNNLKSTNALTIDETTNKTTLTSAQIAKGTDGSIPAAGSVAVSTDANGNIRWAAPSTIAGATGPQGPKGDTGAQGIQGLTGATGPKGDPGAQGIQGLIGATGLKGDTGAQGIQGLIGATGPKGDTGAQGIQGLTGATGPKGDTGATGPAGAAPTTGAGTITGKNLIAISAGDNNAFKNTDISLTAGTDKQVLQTIGTTPTWVNASTIGDNLGNHIATQNLDMSSKNITNISNAYIKNEAQIADRITSNTNYFGIYKNNGSFGIWNNLKSTNALTIDETTNKTTLTSAQIAKGTDGSIPAAGSVAVSTDANGNIRWAAPSTIAGATGPQGPKGDTGSQGIQGLIGATGPKGDTGAQGIQGLTGATGPKGDTGATGPAGAAPTTGAGTITGKNLIAISAGDNNAFKNTDISLTAGTDKQVLQTIGTTPTWVNASTIGDNLGNHIATQNLDMSSKNITNISNAYIKNEAQIADRITSNTNYFGIYKNNGSLGIWNNLKSTNALTIDETTNKTTLTSAQIAKGTDGSIPAAGSVAVSTDANGNIRWAAPSTIAGATGPQGPKGDTGSQGIQGLIGATGPKGDTGAQGIQGLTGATGPKGDTGAQGIQGLTGATGPKGDTGVQGIQGLTGATGPKGDTGAQGIQGLTGATGPAGAAPTTGAGTITGKNLIAISAGANNAFKNTDISLTAGTDKQVLQTVGTTPTWVNASTIGDNLGNHIATQDLNMSSKNILNINNAYIKNDAQFADRITSNTNYFGINKNNGLFGIWNSLKNTHALTISETTNNVGIGIGSAIPTNTLHVKAATDPLKIEGLAAKTDDTNALLVIDDNGVVKTSFSRATYRTANLDPGESATINLIINPQYASIIIGSSNLCMRNALTTFTCNGDVLAFLGGQARNVPFTSTVLDNSGNAVSLNAVGVVNCEDGGGSTQFDFDIKKSGASIIITNRGNVPRTFNVRQNEM